MNATISFQKTIFSLPVMVPPSHWTARRENLMDSGASTPWWRRTDLLLPAEERILAVLSLTALTAMMRRY